MLKSFKYRIYPTTRQTRILESTLDDCRWLYNALLEQRKYLWENEKKPISYFSQVKHIKQLREEHKTVKVFSQILSDVAMRIDLAFKAFFRRVKNKEIPGYPRFKGKYRYDSFTYPQFGFKIINDSKIKLSKIGDIKLHYHRKLEGKPKTCTIKRTPTGKWWVVVSCEIQPKQLLNKTGLSVGIDVGIHSFAHLSDDTIIDNPKFFKESEDKLAKIQRKFSKEPKGTSRKAKLRKSIAKVYEDITNKRTDFAHQMSRQIVDTYDIISIEDLQIQKMVKENHKQLRKAIIDAAWTRFDSYLTYKAVEAGKILIRVNPAYTSQDCSGCGYRTVKKLCDRTHKCPSCGLEMDRDLNAAKNILARGLTSLGLSLNGTGSPAQ